MAETAQGMDPVAWLNRDDMRTEFTLEDGGTITSGEIVDRMCSCYEGAKARGYKMAPWTVIVDVAYTLANAPSGAYWPRLSESSIKSLANRTARDVYERYKHLNHVPCDVACHG